MRKYASLLFITLVIIVVVGAHYTFVAKEIAGLPKFKINTVSGNEEEVDSLIMRADLFKNHTNESLSIDRTGSKYLSEASYIKNMTYYYTREFEQLQKEYRSFMRGKVYHGSYYEDDQYLAYAHNPDNFSGHSQFNFDISILNKETNKSVSFDVSTPNVKEVWYMDILDIQVLGNELKLTVQNEMIGNEQMEVFVHTISIEKMQLTDSEKIASFKDVNDVNKYSYISVVKSDPENHEIVLTWSSVKVNDNAETGKYNEEIVDSELLVYDFGSQTAKAVQVSENNSLGKPVYFDGKEIHYVHIKSNTIEMNMYDNKGSKTDSYSINDINLKSSETINSQSVYMYSEDTHMDVKDGKLFIISPSANIFNPAKALVVDLMKKELLFEGEVKQKVKNSEPVDYYLYIHSLDWER